MTTKHQLSFNVLGDPENPGRTAQSVIDEHCIVDHISFRALTSSVAIVVIHFTAASEIEAEAISEAALKAARYQGSIDTETLKHIKPIRKGR